MTDEMNKEKIPKKVGYILLFSLLILILQVVIQFVKLNINSVSNPYYSDMLLFTSFLEVFVGGIMLLIGVFTVFSGRNIVKLRYGAKINLRSWNIVNGIMILVVVGFGVILDLSAFPRIYGILDVISLLSWIFGGIMVIYAGLMIESNSE